MNPVTRFPQTTGGAARNAYAHLCAAGISASPLLKRAHLTRAQLSGEGVRIDVRSQVEFLRLAAEALDDDLLGFHLAQKAELRKMGLLYFVLASSANLEQLLQRGVRYSRLVNEGLVPELVDGAEWGYRVRYSGISRVRDRHQAEFSLTAMLRMVRQLTGKHLVPARVHMVHPRGRGAGELRRYFGCAIEFGAGVDELLFARRLRAEPVVNADPYLNKLLVDYCEQAVAHRVPGNGPARDNIENAIAPLLPHGRVTVDDIARQMGVGRRTLARQLAAEGTSFTDVMKELRHDLACRYLADGAVPVSKIAWLVGFRDVGTFSHAFRRWSGKSPRDYRQLQAAR